MHPIADALDRRYGHLFDVYVRPSGEVVTQTHTGQFVASFVPQLGQLPGNLIARLVLRMEGDGFGGVDVEQVFSGLQWFGERGIEVSKVRSAEFGDRVYLFLLVEGDNVPVGLAVDVMVWALEVSRSVLLPTRLREESAKKGPKRGTLP